LSDEREAFARQMMFNYPRFTEALFLQAHCSAYRTHLSRLAKGQSSKTYEPIAAVEDAIVLRSGCTECGNRDVGALAAIE
jgi:hypothetical protein